MKKKIIITLIITIILVLILLTTLYLNGFIILTNGEATQYEVKGIDVSNYQGEIDFNKIEEQGISFAFIKATEGSSYIDEYFSSNYENIKNTNLVIGIYHFFSFESSGEDQFSNYKSTVGTIENDDNLMLPIIDIEYYGDYKKNNPNKEEVEKELQTMLDEMEKEYKLKPIIYTTQSFYNKYIENNFQDYDIWIRNILVKPNLEEGRNWTFWQYTDKGKLEGYKGVEKFIDLNVFNGSKEDFNNYLNSKKEEKKINFEKEEESKITSIRDAIITNIENRTLTIKDDKENTYKVTIGDNIRILNERTGEKQEELNFSDIQVNDKITLNKVIVDGENVEFTEDGYASVVRNIHGEELKNELLSQEDIEIEINEVKKEGNNIILYSTIRDLYYQNNYSSAEKFDVKVIVNKDTLVFGTTENQLEEIERMRSLSDNIFVGFDKTKVKGNTIIAKYLEAMGC